MGTRLGWILSQRAHALAVPRPLNPAVCYLNTASSPPPLLLPCTSQAGITVAHSSELEAVFSQSSLAEVTAAAHRVTDAKKIVEACVNDDGHGVAVN